MSPAITFLLAACWLACTLPLVRLGYGSDADAWTLSRTAERIWESGTYLRSRSAGFPLYEVALVPLVRTGGWMATNLLSLAAGAVLMALLVRLARRGGLRHPIVTITTLMFLPVIIKNSTSTMDYVPALAILAGAYVAWHDRRFLLCALLVGVACGVRPTSGLFIVPIVVATYLESRNLRLVALMSVVATAVGVAVLWPSLRLGPVPAPRDIPLLQGVRTGMELFGIAQTPLLAALMIYVRRAASPATASRTFDAFHLTNIAVFGLAFALHPGGTEYLVPAAFSVVLFLDRHASPAIMVAACVVALSYHLVAIDVLGSRGGLRPVRAVIAPGATVRDIEHRRFTLWLREAVAAWPGTQPTVILEHMMHPFAADRSWTYDEALNIFTRSGTRMAVAKMIQEPEALGRLRDAGYRLVMWREREWWYLQAPQDAAHAYIEFVDDLDTVLGVPRRGSPLE